VRDAGAQPRHAGQLHGEARQARRKPIAGLEDEETPAPRWQEARDGA